jgi:hypothetical protein
VTHRDFTEVTKCSFSDISTVFFYQQFHDHKFFIFTKVCLLYTKPGTGLLAFGSKGVMKMWKSNVTQSNPTEKVNVYNICGA